MRRSLILGCMLMLAAAPVFAAVQPGQITGARPSRARENATAPIADDSGAAGAYPPEAPMTGPVEVWVEPANDEPTRPVPEPGTMAMASMGLLALGATLRRRRGR
jgi:uncharacterized protein (TIGR03382 family)